MATNRDPRVRRAPAYNARRQLRRPQHRFNLKMRPYQIQPFCLAPVLPGETMKNLLVQARVVSAPLAVAMRLTGWWFEQYWFYVKHRDLEEGTIRDAVSNMVLDPATDMSALVDADGAVATYCYPGGIDWAQLCLERIVEEYFRDEGEDWDTYLFDGMPMAAIYGKGSSDWSERLTLNSDKRTDESSFDLMDGGATLHPRELMDRMAHWQALREAGLTDMDYQDFVNTYGAETREAETSPNLHRPELLRYERSWQYPTNVMGSGGAVAAAVAWSIADRVDKDYAFNEPGFVIGLCCARPKVYLGNQQGAIAGAMQDVYSWLPAILQDNYEAAYQQFTDTTGPLAGIMTEGYWIDMRDLYLNGDQFVNYAPADTTGFVDLPTATNNRRYATTADIARFFLADATDNKIYVDGVAHFGIAGRQRKTVPGTTI